MILSKRVFICSIFVVLILFSCDKSENFIIIGRLVEDCNGTIPVANQTFHLQSRSKAYEGALDLNIEFTTDAEGKFGVTYNSDGLSVSGIFIRELFDDQEYPANTPIPSMSNVNLGNFVIKSAYQYKLKLEVIDPFFAGDTIYLHDQNQTLLLAIPGPFQNAEYGPFDPPELGNLVLKEDGYYQLAKVILTSNIAQTGTPATRKFGVSKEVHVCDQTEQVFKVFIH